MENQISASPPPVPPPLQTPLKKHSRKKTIIGICLLVLLIAIIFLPFPYYQNATGVCDAPSPSDCPTGGGWKWTKPIYQFVFSQNNKNQPSNLSQNPTTIPTNTPIPTPLVIDETNIASLFKDIPLPEELSSLDESQINKMDCYKKTAQNTFIDPFTHKPKILSPDLETTKTEYNNPTIKQYDLICQLEDGKILFHENVPVEDKHPKEVFIGHAERGNGWSKIYSDGSNSVPLAFSSSLEAEIYDCNNPLKYTKNDWYFFQCFEKNEFGYISYIYRFKMVNNKDTFGEVLKHNPILGCKKSTIFSEAVCGSGEEFIKNVERKKI